MRGIEGTPELPKPPLEIDETSLQFWLKLQADKNHKGNVNKAFFDLQKELNQRKALIVIAAFDESGKAIGYLGLNSSSIIPVDRF